MPRVERRTSVASRAAGALLFAPLLAGQWLSWLVYRRQSARWDALTPQVWMGPVLRESEARLRLVQCFRDMGTNGLDGLFVALRDVDYEVRKNAALALGDLVTHKADGLRFAKALRDLGADGVLFTDIYAEHEFFRHGQVSS